MAEVTGIEWTDHSWSPWWGCIEVSPACDNCYARDMSKRYGFDCWGPDVPRRELKEAHWHEPFRWDRKAEREGVRRRVFPSMCDPFEFRSGEHAEQLKRLRGDFWKVIESTPNLDWLLLTKRPQNIERTLLWRLVGDKLEWTPTPQNVWLGTTVEDRGRKWRIDSLREVPAVIRFISFEALLEDVGELNLSGIGWVIVGGESGHGSRPMRPEWVRSIRDQCIAARVPFLFKQWGQHTSELVHVKSKKTSGRELDGRTWDEFPSPRVVAIR